MVDENHQVIAKWVSNPLDCNLLTNSELKATMTKRKNCNESAKMIPKQATTAPSCKNKASSKPDSSLNDNNAYSQQPSLYFSLESLLNLTTLIRSEQPIELRLKKWKVKIMTLISELKRVSHLAMGPVVIPQLIK